MKTKELVLTAFLGILILVSGYFKIPSPVGGAEFQMSAPIAVTIAMLFGFRTYILAGILASILAFSMGTITVYGILIQFVFRLVVGLCIVILGTRKVSLLISGPLGRIAARFAVSVVTQVPVLPLIISILPGLVITPLVAYILYTKGYRMMKKTGFLEYVETPWSKGLV